MSSLLADRFCVTYSTAQPAGVPEILKKSLHSCSVTGGEEVFIIGKNFLKGTKVIFQEIATGIWCLFLVYEMSLYLTSCVVFFLSFFFFSS